MADLGKKFLISEENGTELALHKEYIPLPEDVKSPTNIVCPGASLQDVFSRIVGNSGVVTSISYDSEERPSVIDITRSSVLIRTITFTYTGDVPTSVSVVEKSGATVLASSTYTLTWTGDQLTGVSVSA